MNENETFSITPGFRLDRIKKVSGYFRLFLQFGFPLLFFLDLVGNIIWAVVRAQVNPVELRQITPIFLLALLCDLLFLIVALASFLVWYWTSLKLFRAFEEGVLFTEKTARYFKIIGITGIIGALVTVGAYVINPLLNSTWPSDPVIEIVSGIYNGIFFIFLGWVFGEAQKIREEQELTV